MAAVGAGEGLDETAFDSLMAALYADPSSDSVRAMGFLDLLGDPAVGRWVRLLIDARFLALNGHSLDQARVSWVFPKALSHWAEAKRWIERHDRLLARAAEFERARQRWEEEERSPVCLLLATRAVDDARDLLDYHIRRPFLTDPLIEYLRESIAIEGRLVEEIRKIAWIKRGAVAAGVVLLGLLAWVVF